jgi:hypothetical protein
MQPQTLSPERAEPEVVFVDMTCPFSALTFPVLELVIITGLAWMGIGYLDSPYAPWIVDVNLRNGVVGLWAILVVLRFILPVVGRRRQRLLVTNHRVLVRNAGFRGGTYTIPLNAIRDVGRRRSNILLSVRGHDRPVVIPDVPRTKKVHAQIEAALYHPY